MIIEFPNDFFERVDSGEIKTIGVAGHEFVRVVRCKECGYFDPIVYAHYKKDGTIDKRYKIQVSDKGRCLFDEDTLEYHIDNWYCPRGVRKDSPEKEEEEAKE